MARLVVFGRKGCHLCDAVEVEIRSIGGTETSVTVVDIEKDPALLERYLWRIPVVTLAGKEVFEADMMDPNGSWKERLRSVLKAS